MKIFKHKATFNDQGRTIFSFLKAILKDVPLSKIEKAFRKKDVRINNLRTNDKKLIIKENDIVIVYGIYSEKQELSKPKTMINFHVIFEDKNILILSKPYDVEVHGSYNCLDRQVLSYLKFVKKDSFVPSHIGRLDKKTSGIMLYAKNYQSLRALQEEQSFEKTYEFKSDLPESIETKFFIYHDEKNKKQRCSFKVGKPTWTIFTVEQNRKFAQLKTGRKHQIRASLSKLGYPIYGDYKYGGKPADKMYLHALRITFKDLKKPIDYLSNKTFIAKKKW